MFKSAPEVGIGGKTNWRENIMHSGTDCRDSIETMKEGKAERVVATDHTFRNCL
jgi:hypothetical protein